MLGKQLIKLLFCLLFFLHAVRANAQECNPWFKSAVEESNIYGAVLDLRYANLLTMASALGIELAFGAKEFRLGGTFAEILSDRHLLKLTAEYLSQQNLYNYLPGPKLLWNEQHAVSAGYSYLTRSLWIKSFNFSGYQARSRDESLPTIYQYGADVQVLYRNVKGSSSYGGNVGITVSPWIASLIDFIVFYDKIEYRNLAEKRPDSCGLGAGIDICQVLNRYISVNLVATRRVLFDQYQAKLNWLIPTKCHAAFELSLTGQRTTGDLPHVPENRVGINLAYIWNQPESVFNSNLASSIEEHVVKSVASPLIRIPETLVSKDQQIVGPGE